MVTVDLSSDNESRLPDPRSQWPRRLAFALAIAAAALWWLHQMASVLLLVLGIFIVAVMVNAPVSWLEAKGWKRSLAAALVFSTLLAIVAGLVWLVFPRIGQQISELTAQLPQLLRALEQKLAPLFAYVPGMEPGDDAAFSPSKFIGSVPPLLGRIGSMSLSIIGGLVMLVIFITTVVFVVLDPKPILRVYLRFFPEHNRDAAQKAFERGSDSVIGYIWANVVVGTGEAILTAVVLSLLGVPGAIVWGVLTFFAELVPKVGGFIMAIPPVLVALAVDPMTALWTALYFLALQIVAGDIIAPKIRSNTMEAHPAWLIIVMLALGSAFGLVGAILATPLAGYITAYYDEFVVGRQKPDPTLDERADRMIAMRGDRQRES